MGLFNGQAFPQLVRNKALLGGGGALLSILPNGPTPSQIANPAGLTDTKGNAVTCTRASTKYCRTGGTDSLNCVTDIQFWGSTAAAVTDNAALAPDGTTTARRVVDNATVTFHGTQTFQYSYAALSTTSTWTFSCYVKAGTCRYVSLTYGTTGGGIGYDLQTGAQIFNTASATGTSTSVGGGWWRLTITGTTGLANDNVYVLLNPSGQTATALFNYAGVGDDIYVWGPRAVQGASAGTFSRPMLVQMGANVPSVEPEGLLVEGASTNLLLQSQAFDNATAWAKTTTTVTADQVIAPDGTLTADRVQISAGTQGATGAFQTVTGTFSATTQTFSVWLRCASGTQPAALKLTYSAVADYFLDVTVTTQWQRFSITRTFATNASTTAVAGLTCVAAGTASDVYAWGAQLENQAFATSYMPTTTVTATRNDDVCSVPSPLTAASPWAIGATIQPLGTWNAATPAGSRCAMALGPINSANSARFDIQGINTYFVDNDGTTAYRGLAATSPSDSIPHRLVGYKSSQTSYQENLDGVSVGAASGIGTGLTAMPTTLYLGANGNCLMGWMHTIKVGTTLKAV